MEGGQRRGRPTRADFLRATAGVVGVAGLGGATLGRVITAAGAQEDRSHAPIRVFYSPAYVLAAHSFETTRKARWVADSLGREPLPAPTRGVDLVAPDPLTEDDLVAVHDPAYVAAVRTGQPRRLAESQGFGWDAGLWDMVLASNGGVRAAARAAPWDGVGGSLSSGLHHAHYDHGSGFCTFNGLAVAARASVAAGVGRVLIVDLDAHCGGGTHELIAADERIWQVDVAVSAFDTYTPAPRNTFDLVHAAGDYLPTISARLDALPERAALAGAWPFSLCVYNAGMDPHEGCPVGGLRGITTEIIRERERRVFAWCRAQNLPVAFVLAGGYTGPTLDPDGLAALHRLTLAEAAADTT